MSSVTKEDDSFFVQIDNGADNLWDIERTGNWAWDRASNRGGADPVIFSLSAGSHTISIKVREDGTKIDKLLLTNDMGYSPAGLGELAENGAAPANTAPVAVIAAPTNDQTVLAIPAATATVHKSPTR